MKEHWEVIRELKSIHEEADTCMLLHTLHAANGGYKTIIITAYAYDADVLVICLGLSSYFSCPISQKCGTEPHTVH